MDLSVLCVSGFLFLCLCVCTFCQNFWKLRRGIWSTWGGFNSQPDKGPLSKVTLDFSVNFKISNTSKIDTDFWLLGFFIIISLRISDKKLILILFSIFKTQTLQTKKSSLCEMWAKNTKKPSESIQPSPAVCLKIFLITATNQEGEWRRRWY